MLFVLVPNGATSFCSLRLISEATKQNGMGHTTTLRENLMNLVLSSSWVNKITVSALIVITQFQGNFVCVHICLKKNIMLYEAYILDSERGRCSNILTLEPEPRGGNITEHFSSAPTCGQMPSNNSVRGRQLCIAVIFECRGENLEKRNDSWCWEMV